MQFTDEERAEIAAEHDEMAADLWEQVTQAEAVGRMELGGQLRAMAGDAEAVAEAARTSSKALARIY